MTTPISAGAAAHDHVFLGEGHQRHERRTWFVIVLCGAMMAIEIIGGLTFGSLALVADGLHMSTHAGALLLAAMAYTYSRRHANDPRFTFGTGKFGDLAGFTSAIVLAMIALLIGYEAIARLLAPVPIHFREAIPIAVLGLIVNIVSAWLLSGGHGHAHSHGHSHGHHHGHGADHHHDEAQDIRTAAGTLVVSIFEDGLPPRFRVAGNGAATLTLDDLQLTTVRRDGARQTFRMIERAGLWESCDEIPEPHAFTAEIAVRGERHVLRFEERAHGDQGHGDHARDNNMRAAMIHVIADAAVSVLVIVGLILARTFGWLWMDSAAGLIGAVVIASWSYGLIRDTSAILLDMNPDRALETRMRREVEEAGDEVVDLHLWRLGPGHLGAIVSILDCAGRGAAFHRARLGRLPAISHLTIEVTPPR